MPSTGNTSNAGGSYANAGGNYSGAGGINTNANNAGGSYSGISGVAGSVHNAGGSYSGAGGVAGNANNAGTYTGGGAGYSGGGSYVADNTINYPENYANYAAPAGYGYSGNFGTTSGSMTYATGTYAGVNVMYSSSGPVGYSGNVAIMYSSPNSGGPGGSGGQGGQGGQLVSPGGSLRGRLPLLLKQPGDGEEPTYVTVKAKK